MNNFYISLRFMQFLSKHRGRENAVPREKILGHLKAYFPNLDDRSFRELYIKQPICVCEDGLFAPNLDRPLEAKECYEYLLKRIPRDQAWARIKILLTYYPCLWWGEENQMDLFGQS
jgi:hypothetical protein